MPPRRWTTEELETAKTMMGEGSSFNDIAKKLDRTASAVESKLKGKTASSSGASASKSSKPKPVADAAPQPEKASTTTPQHAPASDESDDEGGSTMKYIVGAVIVAVIIWLVMS